MKALLSLVFLVSAVFHASAFELPPPDTVTDLSNTLTHSQVLALKQRAVEVTNSTGTVAAVLIVPKLEGELVEDLAMRAAETWRIGKPGVDKSVIFVISKGDRKMTIRTSRVTGQQYTDVLTADTIKKAQTRFRANDFYGGVSEFYTDVATFTAVAPGEDPNKPADESAWVYILLAVVIIAPTIIVVVAWFARRQKAREALEAARERANELRMRERNRRDAEARILRREKTLPVYVPPSTASPSKVPMSPVVVPLKPKHKEYSTPAESAPYVPSKQDDSVASDALSFLAGAAFGSMSRSSDSSLQSDDSSYSSGSDSFSSGSSSSMDGGGSSGDW